MENKMLLYDTTVRNALLKYVYYGGEEKGVYLTGFNKNLKSHLTVLTIAEFARQLYNVETTVKMPLYKKFLFIHKHKGFKEIFKSNKKYINVIEVPNFIEEIENQTGCHDIFAPIWEAYYE